MYKLYWELAKMIVLTGLDGSGKSTFLNMLETKFGSQLEILRLPTMEPEKFEDNPLLSTCCEMINELGERGDKEENPSMKIIAMFSSVALFNRLLDHLEKLKVNVIFCERHPLVDTCIYAKTYLKVMHPSNLSLEKAIEIDKCYSLLLQEVAKTLEIEFTPIKSLKSHLLLEFLYDWFSQETNYAPAHLFRLFGMRKPDKIFFLDAPATVLYDRIDHRKNKEYHENSAVLKKMRSHYHELLPKFSTTFEIIDASSKTDPNALFDRLRKLYF